MNVIKCSWRRWESRSPRVATFTSLLGLVSLISVSAAYSRASTVSYSGTFVGDDQVAQYSYTTPGAGPVIFSTDSYGGGTFNGVTTAAGGFVPVISVFNAANGVLLGSDGGDGICSAGMAADVTTNMCDDASLSLTLGTGSYVVAVSEFFNVPVGPNLSDGFLEQGQGNFTGGTCGTSGAFYETDVAPCVQRDGNFTLNISAVPEPTTLGLGVLAIAAGLMGRRVRSRKSLN